AAVLTLQHDRKSGKQTTSGETISGKPSPEIGIFHKVHDIGKNRPTPVTRAVLSELGGIDHSTVQREKLTSSAMLANYAQTSKTGCPFSKRRHD
ncbi:MAG: hypothetical protein ACPGXX_02190, partial [Planctomycetaceae bacterium]